jgi:hypothetical protein
MSQSLLVITAGAAVVVLGTMCFAYYRRLHSLLPIGVGTASIALAVFGLWQVNSAEVLQVAIFGAAHETDSKTEPNGVLTEASPSPPSARISVTEPPKQPSDATAATEAPKPSGKSDSSDDGQLAKDTTQEKPGEPEAQGGLGVTVTVDDRKGVIVTNVESGSPAEEMGIHVGDRITSINREETNSVRDFISTIGKVEPGKELEFDITRTRDDDSLLARGELESRSESAVDPRQRSEERDRSKEWLTWNGDWNQLSKSDQRSENVQTSYEEERSSHAGGRSADAKATRVEQLELQIGRLSQEIDDLRMAVQDIRRQGREQTASYEEYESQSPRRSASRWDAGQHGDSERAQREASQRDADSGQPGASSQQPSSDQIQSDRTEARKP